MARIDLPPKRLVALAIIIAVLTVSGVAYGLTRTERADAACSRVEIFGASRLTD